MTPQKGALGLGHMMPAKQLAERLAFAVLCFRDQLRIGQIFDRPGCPAGASRMVRDDPTSAVMPVQKGKSFLRVLLLRTIVAERDCRSVSDDHRQRIHGVVQIQEEADGRTHPPRYRPVHFAKKAGWNDGKDGFEAAAGVALEIAGFMVARTLDNGGLQHVWAARDDRQA